MNLIKCDGCEKISPNKHGAHIANGWFAIVVHKPGRYRFKDNYVFCKKCFKQIEQALKEQK